MTASHRTKSVAVMARGISEAQYQCHTEALQNGWWHDPHTGEPITHDVARTIALMHSELSEALEADRKNLMDKHLPQYSGVEVELADLLIRVFDFAGYHDLDLTGALIEKLDYNAERADHKPENRADGGLKY